MPKVSDIHTLWLKPAHLPADGKAVEATIERAEIVTLHPRPAEEKPAIVLSFKSKVHKLILSAGNANRMERIGGDDLSGWPGLVISLKRGSWGNKPTVIIEPAKTNGAK